jgi:hypothetical protein
MEVGTTNFGRYGLIADGKSTSAIFTATANGSAAAGAVTFTINAPSAAGSWFGDATRPAINMLAQVTVSGTTYTYPILSSTANGAGWFVTISRPNPSNRAQNLGLNVAHASGATWSFFLRSMISTASHTMEYAGSGTNYNALPENGGVAIEASEAVNLNNGKVWLTSTDQSGKFKVGDTFSVDQQTGNVNLDPNSYATNLITDTSPELGGDLDVLARSIYSSMGDINIGDAFNTGANLMLVRESSLATAYPVVTQYDIGTDPNQVPLNQFLGTMAFQDSDGVSVGTANIGTANIGTASISLGSAAAPAISFIGDSNTGIYWSGADQVAIATNGTARLFVLSNGSVELNGPAQSQLRLGVGDSIVYTLGRDNGNGYLYFNGTQSGSTGYIFSSPSGERVRIDSSGRLLIGGITANTSGAKLQTSDGITFPATQVASTDPNTLDDYEEGTFTPSAVNTGISTTVTTSIAVGSYVKIGRAVHFTFRLEGTVSSSGAFVYQGFPFASANVTNQSYVFAVTVEGSSVITPTSGLYAKMIPNTGYVFVFNEAAPGSPIAQSASPKILVTGTYYTT